MEKIEYLLIKLVEMRKYIPLFLIVTLISCSKKETDDLTLPPPEELSIELDTSIDDGKVHKGSEIVFNITGAADGLIFFSGEAGSDNDAGDEGTVITAENHLWKYSYEEIGEFKAVFVLINKDGKREIVEVFYFDVVNDPDDELIIELDTSIDDGKVHIGSEIVFNITGRAHTLMFFSGEPGSNYGAGDEGDVIVLSEEIDPLKHTYKEAGDFSAVFISINKDGVREVVNTFNFNVINDPNPSLNTKTLTAGGRSNTGIIGPTWHIDFGENDNFTPDQAFMKQENIDMLYMWNHGGSVPVFLVPSSDAISAWGVGQNLIDTWAVSKRNAGVLVRLENPTSLELQEYEALSKREDLIAAFNSVESAVEERTVTEGYDYLIIDHGPTFRVSKMNIGDIVYFKSESRDVYAALKILGNTPGNGGDITFEVKSILIDY